METANSTPAIRPAWYALAHEEELRKGPIQRTLFGTPLVLFRGARGVGALLDRCSHRNVPLSLGTVREDCIECPYHGWRFDPEGECKHIPGRVDEGTSALKSRHVPAYATRVRDGHIWVYGEPEVEPESEPFGFPHMHDSAYGVVKKIIDVQGTIHAVAENALDVPHTAFLHGGLFRKESVRNRIDVEVHRFTDRVEAHYLGEPRPSGVIGRILAPNGGVVTHVDRFFLPSIAQVEYALGDAHVVATTALTPVTDTQTRMFGVVAFRLPKVPGALASFAGNLLSPLGMLILNQDAKILKAQRNVLDRFGEERYASTELDALGPSISKLMRAAAKGEELPAAEVRRFQMDA